MTSHPYIDGLGLPYMGSKRRLSKKIVDEILEANPNTKYVYDIFGGGGAISFEFIQRKKIKKVFYNELNTGVVELLKKIKTDGMTKEFYNFIDRETFIKHKDADCWYGGLCKVVWSFGNNQKGYLFGKDVEEIKRLGHEVAVNKCEHSLSKLSEIIEVELPRHLLSLGKTKCRQQMARIVKKVKGGRKIELQQLQRLQRLQQLEQLQQLQQLELSNKSYQDVEITTPIAETIIYLDPPYKDTAEYQEGGFNHDELNEYIESSPYKIYVSSYKFELEKVAAFKHTSSLSSTKNNATMENLYCNKEHINQTKLFH